MLYKRGDEEVDLSKITRLYPAVCVKAAGEIAQVSLEWANSKADEIDIESFVLVFDTDPMHEVPVNRVQMHFSTIEELFAVMQDVSEKIKALPST